MYAIMSLAHYRIHRFYLLFCYTVLRRNQIVHIRRTNPSRHIITSTRRIIPVILLRNIMELTGITSLRVKRIQNIVEQAKTPLVMRNIQRSNRCQQRSCTRSPPKPDPSRLPKLPSLTEGVARVCAVDRIASGRISNQRNIRILTAEHARLLIAVRTRLTIILVIPIGLCLNNSRQWIARAIVNVVRAAPDATHATTTATTTGARGGDHLVMPPVFLPRLASRLGS